MSREYFTWTDDETELLLNLTLEYKTEKSIDWESIRSKYSDIHERFVAHLSSFEEGEATLNKEYTHRPEEIPKAIVTSKLKAVCQRYRKAVDLGRRSGQGRVVDLYYSLCQEIWGGSPATEQVSSGLESGDLVEPLDSGETSTADGTGTASKSTSTQPASKSTKDNDILDEPGPVEDDGDIINRRKLLDNKLSNYKQKNLRKDYLQLT